MCSERTRPAATNPTYGVIPTCDLRIPISECSECSGSRFSLILAAYASWTGETCKSAYAHIYYPS